MTLCFPGSHRGTSAASSLVAGTLYLHTCSLQKREEEMPVVKGSWAVGEG